MFNRRFSRKIEIWQKTEVSDGLGGSVLTPIKLKDVWAEIETKRAGYKFIQYGLNDFKNPVIFKIRGKQNNISWNEDTSVKYKGREYIALGVQDVNLEGLDLEWLTEGI